MSCINRFLNIEAFSIPRIIKNFFSIVMVCFSFSVSKYQCFLKHHTCSFSPFNLLCSVWAILFTLMASATTKILLFPKSFSSSCISLLSSRAYIHLPVAHLHIFDHRNFKLQTCCVQDRSLGWVAGGAGNVCTVYQAPSHGRSAVGERIARCSAPRPLVGVCVGKADSDLQMLTALRWADFPALLLGVGWGFLHVPLPVG